MYKQGYGPVMIYPVKHLVFKSSQAIWLSKADCQPHPLYFSNMLEECIETIYSSLCLYLE